MDVVFRDPVSQINSMHTYVQASVDMLLVGYTCRAHQYSPTTVDCQAVTLESLQHINIDSRQQSAAV